MGARDMFKDVLNSKGITLTRFARMQGLSRQTVANMMYRDSMTFKTMECWLDTVGVDIVFRDRATGRVYD